MAADYVAATIGGRSIPPLNERSSRTVERRDINPWSWQDQYGFSQAIEVRGSDRVVYCAGQTSVDADGAPLHPGDMANTDMGAFMEAAESFGPRMDGAGCRPTSTLLEVRGLFHPELMVELEATATA